MKEQARKDTRIEILGIELDWKLRRTDALDLGQQRGESTGEPGHVPARVGFDAVARRRSLAPVRRAADHDVDALIGQRRDQRPAITLDDRVAREAAQPTIHCCAPWPCHRR